MWDWRFYWKMFERCFLRFITYFSKRIINIATAGKMKDVRSIYRYCKIFSRISLHTLFHSCVAQIDGTTKNSDKNIPIAKVQESTQINAKINFRLLCECLCVRARVGHHDAFFKDSSTKLNISLLHQFFFIVVVTQFAL